MIHTEALRNILGSPPLRDTLHPLLAFSLLHRHAAAQDAAPEIGTPIERSVLVLAIHANGIPVLVDIEVGRKTSIPLSVSRRCGHIPHQALTPRWHVAESRFPNILHNSADLLLRHTLPVPTVDTISPELLIQTNPFVRWAKFPERVGKPAYPLLVHSAVHTMLAECAPP